MSPQHEMDHFVTLVAIQLGHFICVIDSIYQGVFKVAKVTQSF
jgi:hypothetical protein